MMYKQATAPPLPQGIDDEHLSATEEGQQPDNLPSRLNFSMYWVKIVSILEDIRAMRQTVRSNHKAHSTSNGPSLGPDPSDILRINSRIEDLIEGAPAHIRIDADKTGLNEAQAAVFRYQGRAPSASYLAAAAKHRQGTLARILLLRPSLLAEAERLSSVTPRPNTTSAGKLEERFQRELCDMCISTAYSVLEEMDEHLGTIFKYQGWYAPQRMCSRNPRHRSVGSFVPETMSMEGLDDA